MTDSKPVDLMAPLKASIEAARAGRPPGGVPPAATPETEPATRCRMPEPFASEYILGDRESLDPRASVTVAWRRGDLWAVTRGRRIRTQSGDWEIEPIPSERTDAFRARCYRPLSVAMSWARAILAAGAP